jgi:PTH1 family peptidyl-tRNA hydrolase
LRDPVDLLLVGLGNPGPNHAGNRHNAGFMLMDRLAERLRIPAKKVRCDSLVGEGRAEGRRVALAKPQTFMNESGQAVACLVRSFGVQPEQLLVAFDDLDLPLGELRLRPAGGSSGHHGMQSVIERLAASNFPRLRIGIGRPPGRMAPADYVLEDFSADEAPTVEEALGRGVDCLQRMLACGLQEAMTLCNTASAA